MTRPGSALQWSITSDKSFSLKELFLLNLIFLIPEQYYWGMDHLYQGKQGPNWWANVRRNFFVSWVFSTWQYSWLEFSLKKLILVAPWFGQSWLHVRMEFVQCPHIWVDLSQFDSSQQVLNLIHLEAAVKGKEQKIRNIECRNIQLNYHQSPIKSNFIYDGEQFCPKLWLESLVQQTFYKAAPS